MSNHRLILGRGVLLSREVCRAVVHAVRARNRWEPSEVGEAGDSVVDLRSCRSSWCWLQGPLRRQVLSRVAEVAAELSGTRSPRLEDPVIIRYRSGDFHGRHADQYERPENAHGRKLSMVAFLTGTNEADGFSGGELQFYLPDRNGELCVRTRAETGHFYVFDSELEHEVRTIRLGERFTLVTWLY